MQTKRWTYDKVVVSDFDAKRHGERAIERETRTRNEDVLTAVCQHRYGKVDSARTAACQYDVLYTAQYSRQNDSCVRLYLKLR